MQARKKPREGRGPTRWPGISAAAADLGVTRGHLYAVLEGKRESKSLLARYRAWVEANPGIPARVPAAA